MSDTTEAMRAALDAAIDEFERKQRGIPQARIAAELVSELRAALAHPTPAAPAVTDSTHTGAVLEALRNYRCQHFEDEDGGLPLVDAIAAALGDRSIGRAQQELELLADHLLDVPPTYEGTHTGEATTDQLIELTAHLERKRAAAIAEDVRGLPIGGHDAAVPTQFHAGFALACEEIAHRLKTEAWGMLPNGGWGPTGAANEDDRPSPEFPELLRRALAAQPSPERNDCEPVAVPAEADALTGDAAQAHQQCRAVVHLALALAEVHVARAAILDAGMGPVEVVGESSARVMEWLGDLLNGMDAAEEGDEWMDDIFEAAHERWPVAPPPPAERHYCERSDMEDFSLRGELTALKCWHRLTGAEADQLVAFFGKRLGSTPGVHTRTPPGDDADGWMPIETAPKDGTEIWAYWYTAGVNSVSSGSFGCAAFDAGRWRNPEDEDDYFIPPTHWRPLPPPPAAATKEPQQ